MTCCSAMADPNFASGTVWTGDNLAVMRGMNSGCVDLIYLDPPVQLQSALRGADREQGRRGLVQGRMDPGRR